MYQACPEHLLEYDEDGRMRAQRGFAYKNFDDECHCDNLLHGPSLKGWVPLGGQSRKMDIYCGDERMMWMLMMITEKM